MPKTKNQTPERAKLAQGLTVAKLLNVNSLLAEARELSHTGDREDRKRCRQIVDDVNRWWDGTGITHKTLAEDGITMQRFTHYRPRLHGRSANAQYYGISLDGKHIGSVIHDREAGPGYAAHLPLANRTGDRAKPSGRFQSVPQAIAFLLVTLAEKEPKATPKPKVIKKGTKVVYFQPGLDGILSNWAKEPIRVGDPGGELKTVTVKKVARDGYDTYYYTEEGVMLTDSDIREVL
jgi:hypothetical protein